LSGITDDYQASDSNASASSIAAYAKAHAIELAGEFYDADIRGLQGPARPSLRRAASSINKAPHPIFRYPPSRAKLAK
jgi:hypothetical protein